MTVPDDYFGWLFQMPISDDFSRWLFGVTVPDSTTDSNFSDQFEFLRPIPISTNHSTDWSHDWFVFERRLPAAELWPRSPPDRNFTLEAPPGDCLCKDLPRYCKRNASQMFLENFKTLSVYLWTTLLCRLNFNKFFYIQTSPLQKYCGFEKPRKVKATFYLFFHRKTTNTKYLLHIFYKKFWKLLFFPCQICFVRIYIRGPVDGCGCCHKKYDYWLSNKSVVSRKSGRGFPATVCNFTKTRTPYKCFPVNWQNFAE